MQNQVKALTDYLNRKQDGRWGFGDRRKPNSQNEQVAHVIAQLISLNKANTRRNTTSQAELSFKIDSAPLRLGWIYQSSLLIDHKYAVTDRGFAIQDQGSKF